MLAQDFKELQQWIEAPFVVGVSPLQFFVLYGLLILIAFMWSEIMKGIASVRSAI